jgi:hypothetical protein
MLVLRVDLLTVLAELVMASRSKEDTRTRMVLPRQDRWGAFHVLVHMIAETLRAGDRRTLALIESKAAICVRTLHLFGSCALLIAKCTHRSSGHVYLKINSVRGKSSRAYS